MRVIEPKYYQYTHGKANKRRKRKGKTKILPFALALLLSGYVYIVGFQADWSASAVPVAGSYPNHEVSLDWPSQGGSAVGAVGYGMLDAKSGSKIRPTASVIKVATVLAILDKYPLKPDQQGPKITLNARDEQLYRDYLSKLGTVAGVQAGKQISQRQAIEAILVASANNIADTTAIWAFGSMDGYVRYANSLMRSYGLESTRVADASGFSPSSESNPRDLVKLGIIALDNPVIAEIITKKNLSHPVLGQLRNTNLLLGESGTVGIKTGNTDQAKAVYLLAKEFSIENQDVTIVVSVMGMDNILRAFSAARDLSNQASKQFRRQILISKGQQAGYYRSKSGEITPVVADQDLTALSWKEHPIAPSINIRRLDSTLLAGDAVGTISSDANGQSQTINLVLSKQFNPPSLPYKLINPQKLF